MTLLRIKWLYICESISGLSSLFGYTFHYHTILITRGLHYILKWSNMTPSTLVFFPQDYFGYLRSLELPYKFQNQPVYLYKKNCLQFWLILWWISILNSENGYLHNIDLPTHEYDISLHLFRASFIFLSSFVIFSVEFLFILLHLCLIILLQMVQFLIYNCCILFTTI